jgi:hypothetical protein
MKRRSASSTLWTACGLPVLPGETAATAANDGLAIDPRTGDIWFAEYYHHRVSRLQHV